MGLLYELRIRARHVLFPALSLSAVAYFAYHGINGDRGLIAWRALQQKVAETKDELQQAHDEREQLERRVKLLYPEGLDRDMLDEYSRRLSNYGLHDEVVIFLDQNTRR